MKHEQMLAWLDEASSYYVGDAARRLKTVSAQMSTIAEDLRASMRNMDWEGEAEKAFVEWATNVANSTTHLSDYAERGSVAMEDNSSAIASAQSAMPRYTSHASAKENLQAALKAHNDPDSQTIARNARSEMAPSEELAAIEAKERENQQAAADQMYRLSSAYQWSSLRMKNEVPPTFPPPPGAFVPDAKEVRDDSGYIGSSSQGGGQRSTGTGTGTGTHTTPAQPDTRTTPDPTTVPPKGDPTGPTHVIRPEVRPDAPVDLGIDSVQTPPKPDITVPTTQLPGSPPPVTKPDVGLPPIVTPGMPPLSPKGGPGPLGPTSPVTGGTSNPRGPLTGGLRNGPGMPREGISGGRQVPSTTGRPQTGIPRSTVVGNENAGQNRTGMGRGMGGGHGMGGSMGGAHGQSGITGGRRLAGETGGVVGGKAQRAGAAGGGKPFTAGGSGLVRGGNAAKPGDREEQNGERPDYLVEDEETWQQGNRRVAPPVID
ncbi:WXG100 family type VII secretion target [Streptomyces sp. NPDC056549]|uniref:WXG100 family type VII secretion target n=1 Tax=Streptomyces sp. NPDC056549 TaxID=3345864 RepID=UPI00367A6405